MKLLSCLAATVAVTGQYTGYPAGYSSTYPAAGFSTTAFAPAYNSYSAPSMSYAPRFSYPAAAPQISVPAAPQISVPAAPRVTAAPAKSDLIKSRADAEKHSKRLCDYQNQFWVQKTPEAAADFMRNSGWMSKDVQLINGGELTSGRENIIAQWSNAALIGDEYKIKCYLDSWTSNSVSGTGIQWMKLKGQEGELSSWTQTAYLDATGAATFIHNWAKTGELEQLNSNIMAAFGATQGR